MSAACASATRSRIQGRRRSVPVVAALGVALVAMVVAVPAHAAWPPALVPASERADRIVVDKSDRSLWLLRDGKPIARYRVALGDAPAGHKTTQGDERTPEGEYRIDGRNPGSRFHLSLRISYPDARDRAQARARGVDPGGDIFIHGGTPAHDRRDWTDGCIAVTDAEIEQLWARVPTGTPVTIRP